MHRVHLEQLREAIRLKIKGKELSEEQVALLEELLAELSADKRPPQKKGVKPKKMGKKEVKQEPQEEPLPDYPVEPSE